MTSDMHVASQRVDLKQRFATVMTVRDLSPTLRRIRFQGEDLHDLPFDLAAPEAHVKLFFPENPWQSREHLCLPDVQSNGEADWHGVREGRFSAFRDYTIRYYDAEQAYIDVDFVLHEGGVGGPWASQAQGGQIVGVFGPRVLRKVPLTARQYILFADETSLPAVARWLEILPLSAHIWVAIEIDGVDGVIELPDHPNAKIHWLPRKTEDEHGRLLLRTLDSLPSLDEHVWCWGACEANTVVALKRALRQTNIPADQVDIKAYWKRDRSDDAGE